MKLVLFLILVPCLVQARVFNIDKQDSGTYIKGNYGLTNVGRDAYTRSSGGQTQFSEEPNFNWGGEVGFVFPKKDYNIRLGFEVVHPQKVSASGSNSAGSKLLTVESSIYGAFPVLHIEYFGLKSAFGRGYFSLGGGYGKVFLSNSYSFTSTGTSLYGVNDYKEKSSQYTYIAETAIGYELYFVNSTTITFDLGYRYVKADSLDYDEDVTTIDGPVEGGAAVLDSSGKDRELDLSGVFVGIGLRFYFNF